MSDKKRASSEILSDAIDIIYKSNDIRAKRRELLLSDLQQLKSQSEWVKCADRLPEANVVVLIYNSNEFGYRSLGYVEDGFWYHGLKHLEFVTHWRELPPAPEI